MGIHTITFAVRLHNISNKCVILIATISATLGNLFPLFSVRQARRINFYSAARRSQQSDIIQCKIDTLTTL